MDKNLKKLLKNLDLVSVFNAVIKNYDYDDIVQSNTKRDNLMKYPKYKKYDDFILKNFNNVISSGYKGMLWEQSESNDSFRHVALNREFDSENIKLRLYLSPTDENLYLIINEVLKKCCIKKIPIYLKYNRENRKDKILFYLNNKSELDQIIEVLHEIKKDSPALFKNLDKMVSLICESSFDGAYITTEQLINRPNGTSYESYNILFSSVLHEIRKLMMFELQIPVYSQNCFDSFDSNLLNNIFIKNCIYVFKKYGLLIFFNEDNKFDILTNKKFSGIYQSLNETITLVEGGLEIGVRLENQIFRYYFIPYGKKIPTDNNFCGCQYTDMNIHSRDKINLYPGSKTKMRYLDIQK